MLKWNEGWSFGKFPLGTEYDRAMQSLTDFYPVEIPHDWLIYNTKDLYEDSFGWYRKVFTAEEIGCTADKHHVIVRFDGVYMDSTVYCNGVKVGDWKYGYSTFEMDLTELVREGENEIAVLVRHQSPNSRWYSGAGIYRNVWIKVCEDTYLPTDGTYVVNRADRDDEKDFWMELSTEVEIGGGDAADQLLCRYTLLKDTAVVQSLGSVSPMKKETGWLASLKAKVSSPKLWDIESPNCYTLQVELLRLGREAGGDSSEEAAKAAEELLDSRRITVGFKTVSFDPQTGMTLNGRPVKVHGVCEHHDLGCLGAAFNETAMLRKFRILRKMGVNAIRTSHNMPAPELMELADREGFLVMSEAFDMWELPKTTYDYGRFFKEWAGIDVRSWIRRDRNHPSLILWSIGNEIYDTHADVHGQEITSRLIGFVREHDPEGNAPITIGSNYMPWENAQKCADIVKFAGYNYGEKYYDAHHAKYSDWIMYGSETASVVQSRGIYHFPMAQSILCDEDEQCSALGNSSTSWGAKSIEQCIIDDRNADYMFGMFLWTGFDYIGEPTPYHTKNSYFGQIDTAGFPKDAFYTLKGSWTDGKTDPFVHLFPYWDFNPGQLIDLRASSNCAAVELFVNGQSYGRQELDQKKGTKLLGEWQVPYSEGVIECVAYHEDGSEAARDRHESFGDSAQIVLQADKERIASAEDLIFLTISTVDAQGRPVENAVDYVSVTVEGAGRLLGMDNGDSTDYDQYQSPVRKLFSGKLLAVIGSNASAGEIRVEVTGEGLKPAEITLQADLDGSDIENPVKAEVYCTETAKMTVPVRKIVLTAESGTAFSPTCTESIFRAKVMPENAQYEELLWQAVNDGGIPINNAYIEADAQNCCAKVTAIGDGAFRVRCLAKERDGRITVISQLECSAEGLGQALLDPYEFVSAGLFSRSYGEIGNGNEKGIATGRDGQTGPVFDNVDFGPVGSDEITVPIFALNGEAYPIEIWSGYPYEEGSEKLDTVVYQKPSIWNTYQPETWKLPKKIRGVATLAFLATEKFHMKGFVFKRYERAYEAVKAIEAENIYGDSFTRSGENVLGIGNNVTLHFDGMHFGSAGADRLRIEGHTPLDGNTIHVQFTSDDGTVSRRILEFRQSGEFVIEPFTGSGSVEFIFLPGSNFDFYEFQFYSAGGNA